MYSAWLYLCATILWCFVIVGAVLFVAGSAQAVVDLGQALK